MATKAKVVPLLKPKKCPICGRPATIEFRPFCSRHCTDVDLARWLTGGYAIPAVEADGESEAKDGEE